MSPPVQALGTASLRHPTDLYGAPPVGQALGNRTESGRVSSLDWLILGPKAEAAETSATPAPRGVRNEKKGGWGLAQEVVLQLGTERRSQRREGWGVAARGAWLWGVATWGRGCGRGPGAGPDVVLGDPSSAPDQVPPVCQAQGAGRSW